MRRNCDEPNDNEFSGRFYVAQLLVIGCVVAELR